MTGEDRSFTPAHLDPAPAADGAPAGQDALAPAHLEPAPAPAPDDRPAPAPAHLEPAPATDAATDQGDAAPRPDTTAEIDVDAVEAGLADPGSTQSFEAIPEERIDADSTYDAGTTTSLMWGARSDVGCVRSHNEDSYLVQSPLFCVCDGMGGHAAGEVASSLAVETIAKLAPKAPDPALLASAVEAANAAIIEAAARGLGKPGMGCTATAAYIEGTTLAIAHVGDSRAYLIHEGTLIRVTHDHSYVEELVDAGEITADEARVHPNRSVITRALGSDPAMYADHFQLNVEEGDRLILCSDGLSSMIPDSEICSVSAQSPTAQMCTDNLVDAALAAGGSDNVTVVVVDIVDDGRIREESSRRKRIVAASLAALAAAIVLAAVAVFLTISGSIFLGVSNGRVAIYGGVPEEVLGIPLYHLTDETTIELDDLPEDTRNRLEAGIPQGDLDEARETIASYRDQIDAEQLRQVQDAETIRGGTDDAGDEGAPTGEDAAGAPAADAGQGDAADEGTLADTVAPTKDGDAA